MRATPLSGDKSGGVASAGKCSSEAYPGQIDQAP